MAALCVLAASPVHAQEWPTRTLTMINPFAPGGPNDVPARLFAQRNLDVSRRQPRETWKAAARQRLDRIERKLHASAADGGLLD